MPAATVKSERASSRPSKAQSGRPSKSSRRVQSSDDENDDDNDEPQANGYTQDNPTQSGTHEDRGSDDIDDEDEQGSPPNGQKRTRINRQGDSVRRNSKGKARASTSGDDDDVQGEEDEQVEEASQEVHREPLRLEPMWRDPEDGYLAGSIVRVKLWNFQTYEGPAEVFPGPYLNLLLGPNGSGKSTIASAIAEIGGIATIDKFVRNGADKGFVEIEIKGRKGMRNTVIRRDINSKNRSSTWLMNGKSVSMKEVTAKVKDFNIQVDNLCAFIPQNRVAEFAGMTPEELLVRTEQAAGDTHLYAWHQKLIEDGSELQKITADLEGEAEQLNRLKARNQELEREVKRWQERQRLEQEVEVWEAVVPIIEYRTARELLKAAKDELQPLLQRFNALQDRNGPMHEMKKELEKEAEALDERRQNALGISRTKWKDLSKLQNECSKQEGELEVQVKKLEGIAEREKRKRAKIQKIKEEILSLEEKIATPPKLEDEATIEAELAHVRQEKSDVMARHDDVQQRMRDHAEVTARVRVELTQAQKELEDLSNVANQRLNKLRDQDPDCAAVVEWLRMPENKARFSGEIAEPAYISLDIPDARYRDHIDSLINRTQVKVNRPYSPFVDPRAKRNTLPKTFVCGSSEDYKLLNKLVNDTDEALGRKARITTWFRPRVDEQLAPPPMSTEQMRSLGFDGYAIDFVTAPPALMWFLKKDVNLHRTAIGLDPSKINEAEAIKAVTPSGQANFIAGRTAYRVSRSRYGRQLSQTSSFAVGKAQTLLFDAIDNQAQQNLDARIQQHEQTLQAQVTREEELTGEHNQIKTEAATCKTRMEEVQARKSKRAKLLSDYRLLDTKLAHQRRQLESEQQGTSLEQEKVQAKRELARIAEHRAQLAMRATKTAREILQLQSQATQAAVQWLQVHTNLEALKKLSNTQDSALTRAHQACEAKKAQIHELKQDAQHKGQIFTATRDALSPEMQAAAAEHYNV
ncbi:Structural maintenance of chromosomes protein 5, partial [Tulasnella sp. 427]